MRIENTEQTEMTEQTEVLRVFPAFFSLFRHFRQFRILFLSSHIANLMPLRLRSPYCIDGQTSTYYGGLYSAKPSQIYSGAMWVETAIDEC
jgi:hypothetical protein